MATPIITAAGKRTCEENRARRAWASAYHREPPKLKLVLADLLPQLLTSPRPVYRRIALTALGQHDREKLLQAIKTVLIEIDYCRASAEKLHKTYPMLYPKPAA
jgi:HEAT repeat protein